MAEFKIGRLRYTWKGQWATGIFYNRDAVVAYKGKTYVCLEPHTSGNFYSDFEFYDPVLGAKPRWVVMLEGTQWKGPWTPNTAYTLGNIVLYSGSLYKCIVNNTSGPVTINLANWEVYVTVNSTWAGNYDSDVIYRVGEVAKYNGIVYKCVEEHTSSSTLLDYSKWEILKIGIEYRGEWSGNSEAYRKNDIVKLDANLWIATQDHTSVETFDEADWDLWIPGLEFNNAWNSTTLYQLGDVVIYGGYSYINKVTNNINIVPSLNAEDSTDAWELLTTGYSVSGDWSSSESYKIGSVVRRAGNVFVATQDNISQDPTDISLSKTYVASGSSEITVKLNNTTGLTTGMIVSGPGFDKGQFITSVIDNTTIKVSQPPYTSIVNSDILTFSGVDAANWELISAGVRWKNRWSASTEYVTGDIAVWKNATYCCIKTHNSNDINRPDLDITRSLWIVYFNHDQYNVLNQPGDIIVNTEGANSALAIGSEGFLLKSVYGIPTWSNVFRTPAVYYVKPGGTDEITSGDTWDNPFGSIKYACERIAQGTSNPVAKNRILENKQFIIEEINSWVEYQVTHSNFPFLGTDNISSEKTKRDTSFLLDAIMYDIARGSNSQTIAFLYSFFDKEYSYQFATIEISDLMPQFIVSISKTFEILLKVLNNEVVSPLYQEINNSATVVRQVIGEIAPGQSLIDIQSFEDIIVRALTEGNTNSIPPENQGLTSTLMVKTGTYEESLPILVPANTALVGDELRGAVVRPKVIINTIATRSQAGINLLTVKTTAGLIGGMPIQFASMNPVSQTNTVFGGVTAGITYYVVGGSITSTKFAVSEVPGGPAISLVNYVSQMRVYGGDALRDMFYVQNGTGIRNMTLTGLLGTLSEQNEFETRRPTGGSYVSLDPGTGPNDTSAWIYRKSPYIQNVTTFGTGATGLKIDGDLHNGGNKSVVCNDFTQIVSDGIGVWCTGPDSLCEAVSVFAYYAYAGYFAEAGGRIRATNGNSSYGTYGVLAEGFNPNEQPITGTVYNRYYEASATPLSSLGANAEILKLQYSHAGENYNSKTTNLLKYSNLFTNWNSDDNVTLIQSIVSPSGQSNGWIATGNTSGTDSSYFYQDVTIAPSGATYTALSGDSQTGGGVGATFDVVVTSNEYIVTVNNPGSGYVTTTQIQINGSKLGGINGINDLIITVASLINGTEISTISTTGTVPQGSTQPYIFSIYCKKGSSTIFDVTATFNGYSSVTSGVSLNLNTNEITPISVNGGMSPSVYASTPVSGSPGWYRLDYKFYDVTALNNSLEIRIYPRSRFGNAGSTVVYGAQLEIGNTLGFYLNTTTEQFTAYANYNVIGAGSGVDLIGDELRSGSVFQTRILQVGDIVGGTGYLLSSNNAQSGDSTSIVIAQSDIAGPKDYLGMRLFINSGTGAGQYGTISSFDVISKNVSILKESFSPVTVTSSESATNRFALFETEDVNSLYINQPVQFVPTNFNITVTNISQRSIDVTEVVGGTTNIVKVSSTFRLSVDMPITFSGVTSGGITTSFTYYILTIVDDTTIQLSTTLGGAVVLLNSELVPDLTLNYPAGTSQLTSNTANMDINLPIYFTGNVFSDIVPGQTYYINEIYNDTEFTISSNLAVASVSATAADSNYLTVDDTTSLHSINPIIFTGVVSGGITADTKYYINHIVDLTRITVSQSVINNTASSSMGSSNLVTVSNTNGFVIGNPIIFTGTTFGGIINDRVYYIHYVNNENTITISNTSSQITINATQTFATTNNITISSTSNLTPLNPIKFAGTEFGGILNTQEYYISRIIGSDTLRVSASIISVDATETEATSNLVTVASTSGFVANNPIIFGGTSIGGIVSGNVYYISAINNETTLTISSAPGGAAVTLTTGTGSMTARTTAASITLSNDVGSMNGYTRFTGSAVDLSTGVGECNLRTTASSVTLTTSSGGFVGTSTVEKSTLTAGSGTMTGTFSVPLFGGIQENTTYYVKEIIPGLPNAFTVSDTEGGAVVPLETDTGSMRMGELGWDHVNPGTPLASIFDSTTVYSIEPLITYSKPGFVAASNTNLTIQAPGTTYVAVAHGADQFVALPNADLTLSVSIDGNIWGQQQLPTSASWTDIVYGNNYWVIISSGGSGIPGSKVLFSNSNLVTWKTSYLPTIGTWSKVVYGNGKFVAITNDSSSCAYSIDFGTNWVGGTGLPNATWTDLAYGNGRYVAVSGSTAAFSTNGSTWTASLLPTVADWSSVEFGNGRFVAVSSTSAIPAYSFDGQTWYTGKYSIAAEKLSYGNGVFLATGNSSTGYISEDGIVWTLKSVPANVGSTTFGFDATKIGIFVGVSGQNSVAVIKAGSQTKARPTIYQNKIVTLDEWDPGSNYVTAPTVTIIDSNATKPASVLPALGNGVLGNPTFFNKGSGYSTTSTTIIISGNGYAESYQVGLRLIVDNLTRLPSAGDNLTINGNSTVYKITDAVALDGTVAPSIKATIGISPSMSEAKSPSHGSGVTIRTKYSQVRLTNHDFLNIGYGNFEESNYPKLPASTLLSPQNEAVESNYGRVFYSSTDQDGNFKVGGLFAVEQATGIVTLSASQFGLDGLSELRLGGIAVGGNSVVITAFSTESTFVANSNNIIPTQRAIKSYLTARLSQGGANTFTGQLIAGTVLIGGPDRIASTIPEGNEGSHVNIPVKVNVRGFEDGGWDGDGMALSYFMKTFATGSDDWKV